MYYGINISASGVLTATHRLDAMANNLANIDTAGFKPVEACTMQRDPARIEDRLGYLPSNLLMEKLGAGCLMAPTRLSFRQGPVETTGNDLDIAIDGDGFFLARTGSDGTSDQIRLTRDGRLALDPSGRLVQAASGLPILSTGNTTIRLRDDLPVEIDNKGIIHQGGSRVAQIRLVDVPDRSVLHPIGDSLFEASNAAAESFLPGTGRILQRAVEGSAVDEVNSLLQLQGASAAISSNIRVMSYQDRMVERAINTFGRIA